MLGAQLKRGLQRRPLRIEQDRGALPPPAQWHPRHPPRSTDARSRLRKRIAKRDAFVIAAYARTACEIPAGGPRMSPLCRQSFATIRNPHQLLAANAVNQSLECDDYDENGYRTAARTYPCIQNGNSGLGRAGENCREFQANPSEQVGQPFQRNTLEHRICESRRLCLSANEPTRLISSPWRPGHNGSGR
jgi:hypothetical protein